MEMKFIYTNNLMNNVIVANASITIDINTIKIYNSLSKTLKFLNLE